MAKSRITDRSLSALKAGEIIWDTDVAGLGARRRAAYGAVTFVFKYRSPVERDGTGRGKQRMLTLGRRGRGDLGIDDARKEATGHRDALRLGRDPALQRDQQRGVLTVADLCALYVEALPTILVRGRPKKPSTILSDRSNINRHIVPVLGTMAVSAVQAADIRRLMQAIAVGQTARERTSGPGSSVRGGRGAASRCIGLLGGIFTFAVREGLRPDNPVRGVQRYAYKRRERRLSDEEYASLGAALAEARAENPAAAAVTRFLLLSGWRLGEVLGLRWSDLDLGRRTARLPDTKTGASMRPVAGAVCDLLRETHRAHHLVFPGGRRDSQMSAFPRLLARIVKAAGLPKELTAHTLRHSFASLAADLGLSEPSIAALVGHRGGSITRRYIHSADAVLLAAADMVATETLQRLGERTQADVVQLRA